MIKTTRTANETNSPLTAWFGLTLTLFLVLTALLQAQQEEMPIKEYMEVTNVSLIVRAFQDGKPVKALTADDFSVLENGRLVSITSFSEIRKKIGRKTTTAAAPPASTGTITREPRLFILYFQPFNDLGRVREMLNYFFKKVYRPKDKVLMVSQNKLFKVAVPAHITPAARGLMKFLSKYPATYWRDLGDFVKFFKENEGRIGHNLLHNSRLNKDTLDHLVRLFQVNIDAKWSVFAAKHLDVNTKMLTRLSAELKKINMEKWGIVFGCKQYLPDLGFFRAFKPSRQDGNLLQSELALQKALHSFGLKLKQPDQDFSQMAKLKQAFVNGDATFHVVWLERLKMRPQEGFDLHGTYSGWLEAFKGISQVTGGEMVRGNDMEKALDRVTEKEDIYYRLTYAPTPGKKTKRSIEVRSNTAGIKVFYQQRVRVTGKTGRVTLPETAPQMSSPAVSGIPIKTI